MKFKDGAGLAGPDVAVSVRLGSGLPATGLRGGLLPAAGRPERPHELRLP
ncbi:MAG: hypothetical protein Kow001_18410 [Acidobacteriota bacterium]